MYIYLHGILGFFFIKSRARTPFVKRKGATAVSCPARQTDGSGPEFPFGCLVQKNCLSFTPFITIRSVLGRWCATPQDSPGPTGVHLLYLDPMELESGAPQHIWYRHHMQHQPRGFASLSGAPQHIWYAYEVCTSPAGSPPVSNLYGALYAKRWHTHTFV